MATRVLLTVDTELASRHFVPGGDWRETLRLSFDPAGVGVPYQLKRLAEHELKACFFVDPMPALLFGIEPVRRMVEPILEAGQEVQLHLHSYWASLAEGGEPRHELTQYDAAGQRRLIETARDLLVEAGAPPPAAFRSGSYAANADTLAALAALGLRHDSSHDGCEHPWPSALPLEPALIDPVRIGGVTEVPVTQIERRGGGLRRFQICALSGQEMRSALRHAEANAHPLVTIVSHSFELASRDGRRINRLVRKRFERLCAFLAENREIMPTMHFADLPDFAGSPQSRPMPANRLRTFRRLAEQGFGNACFERPVLTSALVAPAPLTALGLLVDYAIL